MIKAALWGYGGIASIHRRSYAVLEEMGVPVKLVAVCDIRPEQFTREIKINISEDDAPPLPQIEKCYTNIDEMIANEDLDMIDICLPAYLHKDAAIKALNAGYNVLSEKPMALSYEDCRAMIDAAEKSKGKLMIGQSVRQNYNYNVIKQAVESGEYGKVISGSFHRLSTAPLWAWENWYMDVNKSGGVNFDLHVHDIDILNYIFGTPSKVSCVNTGNPEKHSGRDVAFTTLFYDNGAIISGRGDWCQPAGYSFSSALSVTFENATLELKDGKLTKITDNKYEDISIKDDIHNIAKEIRYLVDCIENNKEVTMVLPESTANTIKIQENMLRSAKLGGVPVDFE